MTHLHSKIVYLAQIQGAEGAPPVKFAKKEERNGKGRKRKGKRGRKEEEKEKERGKGERKLEYPFSVPERSKREAGKYHGMQLNV